MAPQIGFRHQTEQHPARSRSIMIAAIYDLSIDEGADYFQSFTFLDSLGAPIDITGAISTAQIRKNYADIKELVNFTIINGGVTGVLTIKLLPTDTANLPFTYPPGQIDNALKCVWDLFFVDTNGLVSGVAGAKIRLIKGNALLYPQVTR
jgi:hypothetical protein